MFKPRPFVAPLLLLGACAANNGTHPQDMSAVEHFKAASKEQKLAEEHAGAQGAEPTPTAGCGNATATESGNFADVCWSIKASADREREQEVARHRELAAKHRAAAMALEEAEATECKGISADDRDMSPFFHEKDILSVREVRTKAGGLAGAVAIFRRVPGLTVKSLQRLVDCHMARAAAVGHNMPEMDYCPLVLKGVHASVSSNDQGLAVTVTSEDHNTAAQILRRASRNGALWHAPKQ